MLSGLTHRPKHITPKTARSGIDTLIYLKQALQTAPTVASALEDLCKSAARLDGAKETPPPHQLVSLMIENLRDPALHVMQQGIDALITESTSFSKSSHEMRHQECFALRTGIHGLLDVSRKTFLQTVEDLYKVRAIVHVLWLFWRSQNHFVFLSWLSGTHSSTARRSRCPTAHRAATSSPSRPHWIPFRLASRRQY
jgi:hypothetical protein